MSALRGITPSQRTQRRLVVVMLVVNLAGIAGIALHTGDPHGLALGLLPFSMLAAALP